MPKMNNAINLCNGLCEKYKDLSKKERIHTEQMIKYISREEAICLIEESVRIGVEPDRKRLHAVTKIPFVRSLFFKVFRGLIHTMFNEEAGVKTREFESDNKHYRVDVLQCPYMKYCELLGCKELTATFCLSDDRVYGNLRGIIFRRQSTIGRGSGQCDFYFYRN